MIRVYALPDTVKLRRDRPLPRAAGSAPARLDAAKNECVCWQLAIRGSGVLQSAAAAWSGPAGGGVSVYIERFQPCAAFAEADALFPAGEYPDLLVPISCAPEEERRIRAGENFLLWIVCRVPADTPAGGYGGRIRLDISGEVFSAPFSLRVYDCALPDCPSAPSCFYLRYELLENGEGYCDAALRTRYYEYLLENRLNAMYLPAEDRSPEKYADAAEKYFSDGRVLCYALPTVFAGDADIDKMFAALKNHILELAARSGPSRNLLAKAYTYFYDEPELGNGIAAANRRLDAYRAMLREAVTEIGTGGRYADFRTIDGWRTYVAGLKTLGTINMGCWDADLSEKTDIWCPAYVDFRSEARRRRGAALAARLNAEIWWYGCMGPVYPYPTYHIRDRLLAPRLVSWMQKRYDVVGNLYWSVAHYEEKGRDYCDGVAMKGMPEGDGFLVYPGRRYGIQGPLPSVRLMSIRAGMQDYELLVQAERMFGKAYVDGLCEDLFAGMVPFDDPVAFAAARVRLLADLSAGRPSEKPERKAAPVPIDRIEAAAKAAGNAAARQNYGLLHGVPFGRGVEMHLRADGTGRAEITLPAGFSQAGGVPRRLGMWIYNAESRSLTLFAYACRDGPERPLGGLELYPNDCQYLNLEPARFAAEAVVPQTIKLRIRNTYAADTETGFTLFVNCVEEVYDKEDAQ